MGLYIFLDEDKPVSISPSLAIKISLYPRPHTTPISLRDDEIYGCPLSEGQM